MNSLPVTLIVKAPNQQIEDQRIRCETSWSINKLKQHLSEVYPSKPPQHEQKLIYSGQLLTDTLLLKDVLRQYEGQDTHTVHLVCTPKPTKMNRNRPTESTSNATRSGSASTSSSPNSGNASAETTGQSSQQQPTTTESNNRVPTTSPNTTGLPQTGFPWANYQMPANMDVNQLNQYQMQMAWMQQAYMQYMAQYMQLASGQIPPTQFHQMPYANAQVPLPNQPEMAAQAPQQNPVAQPQPEPLEEQDWLDMFYMLSRVMILLSVLYFYSNPVRFIFVLLLGIFLYMHHTGFFRNININNNNINGTPEGAPQEEQAPTRFMVAWTFITTFFASLIPEINA